LSSQLAGSGWAATAGSVASPSRRCSTLYSWPRRSFDPLVELGEFLGEVAPARRGVHGGLSGPGAGAGVASVRL